MNIFRSIPRRVELFALGFFDLAALAEGSPVLVDQFFNEMLPLKERRISTGSAGSAGSATQVWRKEKWDQNLVHHVTILWGDEHR